MLKKESEIIAGWRGNLSSPLVSVLCITYNHGRFIAKTIESFLMQELDEPFEILIHDDASIDGTTDIILHYKTLYPNIVKPVIQAENQFSRGRVIFDILKRKAIGKYLAYCEGDDYWTDPFKLKLQCSYLEQHPEVVVTGHDSCTVDVDGKVVKPSRLTKKHRRDYTAQEMATGKAWMLNLTLVFRNVDFGEIPERANIVNNDKFLVSLLGNYGSSHFHPEITPAFHVMHSEGMWSGIGHGARNEAQINSWFWIYKYYKRVGKDDYAEAFWNMYLRRVFAQSSRLTLLKEVLIRLLFIRELAAFTRKRK